MGALGLLLPVVFHAVGGPGLGRTFLPMHLPILVAGFVVGPGTAVSLGLIVPLLSAALTGMPPFPVAPLMSLDLMAKGGLASVLYRVLRLPIWLALPVALAADWAILALATLAAADFFGIRDAALVYVAGVIVVSLPGTVLQMVGAPVGVAAIERRLPRLALDRQRR